MQGPTSAGKTSMVERLAQATGHRLVRINNHEHTDVQEYIGSFQPDAHGRLHFSDGALAQAVRCGHWIVLDELNLAPSEVMHEWLNRMLKASQTHAHTHVWIRATRALQLVHRC